MGDEVVCENGSGLFVELKLLATMETRTHLSLITTIGLVGQFLVQA
jgi:hypothetical protein